MTEIDPAYGWLSVAVLLAIIELLVPGVFLIWLAGAAAITGVAAFFLPMTFTGQLTLFCIASVAAVLLGRRWYERTMVVSSDPLLNDRAARLAGTLVTVTQPVSSHSGRAKVGDSEWPARGPELAVGTVARVARVEDGILRLTLDHDAQLLPPARADVSSGATSEN
jgi:membrane protein implicated in regulation of membrane protease activity